MAIIKSLVDQVYDYISTKVKVGDLNAGERIHEAALIQEMGISRTPIREALLRLASDGILESVPRKGFFVRSYE